MEADSLDIKISAEANKANASIEKLIKKFDRLSASLSGVNSRGLSTLASGVNNISNAVNNFSSNVRTSDFTKIAKGLNKLATVQPGNMQAVGNALRPLASGINTLSSANFDSRNINNLINSLTRLSNANVSGIANLDFTSLGNSIKSLANTLSGADKVQQNTISMTNAIAKLASAGTNAGNAAAALPNLSKELKNFMQTMSGSFNIEQGTISMTQALAQLASAGKKAEATAKSLDLFGNELLKFFQTMSKAPSVSTSTIQMTQALAQLASAGRRARGAVDALGNVFSSTRERTKSLNININILSKSLDALKKSFRGTASGVKTFSRGILSAVGTLAGVYGSFEGIKKAIDISSDLTEVQNVIDVSFGNYKDKIEDFSKVSITDFGMSELTAKQMAGRFQSMGLAMGFAQGQMADMSVELTKLAADMSSFYNVEQEEMATSLQSIFTGETEPLRRYGIDLTQATLQEWALKRGIDANIQSMSQMEKTMLRYQYVMANTAAAQGDFARTSGTWANQVRVLKQSFEVLGSTVGGVLINILKPFVAALNQLMVKINDFAKVISESLGTIFGWTYEESNKGAVNDFSEGFSDASDNIEEADKNAKKLKRTILGFDQLNILSDNSDLKNTIDGLGDLASTDINTGEWKSGGDSLLKSFNSDLDTLEKLGEEISKRLTKAMNSIDWDSIYEKASSFGTGLASFLNGLITPELFDALGRTIANSLNTALHFLNDFGEEFDWGEFGESLATGLKSFFSNFDWDLSVDTFNTLANGILTTIISALEEMPASEWKKVAEKIAEIIKNIDVGGITFKVGKIANKLANDFYALVSVKETWTNLGKKIAEGINKFLKGMDEVDKDTGLNGWEAMGKSISKTISGFATTITTALKKVKWEKVGEAIFNFISSIEWDQIGIDLGNMVNALVRAIKKLVGKPKKWEEVGEKLAEGINKFFETFDPEELADAANSVVDCLKKGIVGFMKNLKWKDILEDIGTFLGNLELDTVGFLIGSFLLLTGAGEELTSAIFKEMIINPIKKLFAGAFGAGSIGASASQIFSVAVPVGIGIALSINAVKLKERSEEIDKKVNEAFTKGNIADRLSASLQSLTDPYKWFNEVFFPDSLENQIKIQDSIKANKGNKGTGERLEQLDKNVKLNKDEKNWFFGTMTDEEVQKNVQNIQNKIKEFWGEKVELPVEGSLKKAKENTEKWKEELKERWDTLKLAVKNKLETTQENINGWKEKIKNKWNELKLGVKNKLETTKENLDNFKETLVRKWGTFKLGVKNKLETTKNNIEEFFSKISGWWGERKLKVSNKLSTLRSDISTWWSNIKSWWGEKTLKVKVVFDTIKEKIKGAVESVGDFFGGSSKESSGYSSRSYSYEMPQYDTSGLGWYAKGGIFDRKSIIGIAESGREAVLPLENPKSMSMIAESIMNSYNSTNREGMKEEIKDAVIQGMMEAFMATRDSHNNQNNAPVLEYTFKMDSETLYKLVLKGKQKYDRRYNVASEF